jgi:branched-subunit amino acid ABC-type transport system permease component
LSRRFLIVATIIGGITSIPGTIAGGYLLGFGENFIMYLINRFFGISLAYKPLISLSIMFIALLIRAGYIPIKTMKQTRIFISFLRSRRI